MTIDFRPGRWQDVLSDVKCDALICDPPYSERTHKGQRSNRTKDWLGSDQESKIIYGHVTQEDVTILVNSWVPRTSRWFVMFGDHISTQWALQALSDCGWYSFAPVPWVKPDGMPRIMSDGPSQQAEWIAVGRSRHALSRAEKHFRPGFYSGTQDSGDRVVVGGKPIWLMRAIIRDYSRPGDLICDPCAGGGTTLLAAAIEGRRAVGAEMDPTTFALAQKRIDKGYTPSMFTGDAAMPMVQEDMFGGETHE